MRTYRKAIATASLTAGLFGFVALSAGPALAGSTTGSGTATPAAQSAPSTPAQGKTFGGPVDGVERPSHKDDDDCFSYRHTRGYRGDDCDRDDNDYCYWSRGGDDDWRHGDHDDWHQGDHDCDWCRYDRDSYGRWYGCDRDRDNDRGDDRRWNPYNNRDGNVRGHQHNNRGGNVMSS